ncbi:hypothetical protein HPB50_014366 [Hyalomma asiaticum]|uniref:Uncharacterized protein n=1 Tax=Hyalomma asiaticum TaxID=266040 RepID=A0ACB7SEG8_HYAAI|nr:hypothetical protein HPB50_014366 [Hyalomma asiaticum]
MYREDPSGLRKEFQKRFLPTGPPPQYPNYRHAEKSNEELDTDITVDELRVVVQDLRRNTAPVLTRGDEDTAFMVPTWVRKTLTEHPLPQTCILSIMRDAGARVGCLEHMLADIPETMSRKRHLD